MDSHHLRHSLTLYGGQSNFDLTLQVVARQVRAKPSTLLFRCQMMRPNLVIPLMEWGPLFSPRRRIILTLVSSFDRSMGLVDEFAGADQLDLGPSSNIAFTNHISLALAKLSRSGKLEGPMATSDRIQLQGGLASVSRPPSPLRHDRLRKTLPEETVYSLPSDSETLGLIYQYFSDTALLFPYIHEKTFMNRYEQLKESGFQEIPRTWLGLLNMILALAKSTTVRLGINAARRVEESDVFYQRSLALCEKQIMRGTSLEAGTLFCGDLRNSHSLYDVCSFG